MGKVHERIDGRLRTFIECQHVFFVATAPTDPHGRKGDEGQADYRRKKNLTSIDGLPAFDYDPA